MNPRPIPRYTYERRQRLHRAMVLRRRMRVRQAGLVIGSLLTLTLSLGVVLLINHVTHRAPAAPLFVVADNPNGVTHFSEPSVTPTSQNTPTTTDRAIDASITPAPQPPLQIHNEPAAPASQLPPVKYFGQRAVRPVRTIRMLVTAYCPGPCCCGKHADGKTASGKSIYTNAGHLVAADTRVLPFNTMLTIPGYDGQSVVPVLDRGGKIKGNRLDLLFPTHAQAKQWGARWLDVTVWEYAQK